MEDFVSAPWLRRLLTVALLGGLVVLGFQIIAPFVVPLLWAAILAYVSWPAYAWLLRWRDGRPTLAALSMTVLVSAAVIVPLAWLAVVLRIELLRTYHEIQVLFADNGLVLSPAVLKLPWIGDQLKELSDRIAQDPQHALGFELRKLFDHFVGQITRILGDLGRNALKLAITVLSLFFVFRGGARFAAQVQRALEQVLGPRVDNYLTAIGQTVKAVIYGLGLSALVLGVLMGLGYWLAGVGAPIFLAALTTIGGIIPFAAPLLWGGVSVWLIGHRAHRGGGEPAHLGLARDRRDRPLRAPAAHQPRRADPLPHRAVRRARGARGLRLRRPVHRAGDPRGAARGVARVAGREQPATGLAARLRCQGTCGRPGWRSPPRTRSAAR